MIGKLLRGLKNGYEMNSTLKNILMIFGGGAGGIYMDVIMGEKTTDRVSLTRSRN